MQQYAWGRQGSESTVARLKRGADPDFAVAEEERYAELWMGTHPKAPALMADGGDLVEWLKGHPEVLGEDALEENGSLPFLFKVLSIDKALSVQAHPDKALAEKLHGERPDVYKDPNHKPEYGIALTPFEGLCEFRRAGAIAAHLAEHPEFRAVCGEAAADAFAAAAAAVPADAEDDGEEVTTALKELFRSFMEQDVAVKDSRLEAFLARLAEEQQAHEAKGDAEGDAEGEEKAALRGLMLRIAGQFPGDVGAMVPLLLNYLRLQPGQGFFMGANKPHAYLSGDILEIMACSDNVVRVALTPKYRDVATLVDMLTYETGAPEVSAGAAIDEFTRVYAPPVYECEVDMTELPPAQAYQLRPLATCTIFLVLSGGAAATATGGPADVPEVFSPRELTVGSVILVAAGAQVGLVAGDDGIVIARAHTSTAVANPRAAVGSEAKKQRTD